MHTRRQLMMAGLGGLGGLASTGSARAAVDPAVIDLMRRGGVVLAMRHALAPGTYDPPGFSLDQCSTQRNLSDGGRLQARQIGARIKAAGLQPARVRSSPWCRCVDTAELAFGQAERWTALGSPRGFAEATNEDHLNQLRQALTQVSTHPGRLEVWVTHNFVLSALAGASADSGEGLLLRSSPQGAVQQLGRVAFA